MQSLKRIYLILLIPIALNSQIMVHKNISAEDGLINNRVYAILEDSQGYLWFGTHFGISRWDGQKFYNFSTKDGIASPTVFDIVEGKDSTIYFSTYGGGITSYQNGKFSIFNTDSGLATNWINNFFVRDNGDVYVTGIVELSLLSNQEVIDTIFTINSPITKDDVWSVYESPDSTLYVGAFNGLQVIKNGSIQHFTTEDGLVSDTIWTIAQDANGVIYLGTQRGVSKYFNGVFTSLRINGKLVDYEVHDIIISSDKKIYYATSGGLIIEANDKYELITKDNGLQQNEIWSIYEDKHGTIYIGTNDHGVDIYSPGKIETVKLNEYDNSKNILSISQDSQGKYYLGTGSGVLTSNNSDFLDIKHIKDLKGQRVHSITINRNNNVYFGLDYKIGELEDNGIIFHSLKNIDTGFNKIQTIFGDHNDQILIGSQSGAYIFNNNEFNLIKLQNDRLPSFIQTISSTNDTTLLLGTHGMGMYFFKNESIYSLNENNGLTHDVVNCIYVNENNTIFAGTEQGGVTIIRNFTVTDTINSELGLTSNTIMGIIGDNNGNIYISTTRGVNVLTFYAGEPFIRTILKEDGLVSNNTNRNAVFKDKDGLIWFGSSEGVSKYNPDVDKMNSDPPNIYITGIEIFNKDYSLDSLQELKHDQNFLKFVYTGINLSAPNKIIYQYRLKGSNDYWLESKINYANFTNLDDGNYTFEVKARNEWGYWSEPASLSFVISPAWWETWWFYTLSVLSIGFLIAFFASYRYRNLLAIEKMRSKISADLHDSVGSGLSEISILTELIGAQIPEDRSDLKSGMSNVTTISRTLIESMSDIVWLVNPKKDSLKDLFKRLQMSYHEVLKYTDIDLSVENIEDLDNIHLPMHFRQHLYLIFKEAINNAIKYSGGDLLKLSISTSGNNLTVVFSDNGKGFDQNNEKMGNGLINMKNRAKEIGGNIKYKSEINKGTIIKFTGKFQKQKFSFI